MPMKNLFKGEEEQVIGGSDYNEACMSHWRGLTSEKKAALMSLKTDDIYEALTDKKILEEMDLEGEPSEEVAKDVVKAFLFALEVNDGQYRLPTSPTLEFVGVYHALQNNLLIALEEANLLQNALMTWYLALWRQPSPYWWIGLLLSFLVLVFDFKWCLAFRNVVWKFLSQTLVKHRRNGPYIRWKQETFFVSILTFILATRQSRRWYYFIFSLALIAFYLDSHTGVGADNYPALRGCILWLQKTMLLLFSYHSYVALCTVSFYYFPTILIVVLTGMFVAVGFGLNFSWMLFHAKVLGRFPRFRDGLDEWWTEGREGLNRAFVFFLVGLLLIPYTFYKTWNWSPKWLGTFCRFISVCVVGNVVSVDDFQKVLAEATRWGAEKWERVRYFVRRTWKKATKSKKEKEEKED